ncbi:MAG: fatty acid desaturase [Acidiphilium sp.]|nr:fatty acid desaturase [Acidiphilium sp.]MDD4936464.1 fatty acid desaturase [Acidiphilium sp.]
MRLPAVVQPFLTWLTAKPAPGEPAAPRKPITYVNEAVGLVFGGCVLSILALAAMNIAGPFFWMVLFAGLLATTSGLGLFQVVIFHHCSHGTVFSTRERNRIAGRLVSAILLFKHFDVYQSEHMLHHNANKLFTDEDEYTDFVVGICDFRTATERRVLWRRLFMLLVSPVFHGRFLFKRIQGSLGSNDRTHNLVGIATWGTLLIGGILTHTLVIVLVAWGLPLTILLQIATVFRILCEHRLPPVEVIAHRGKQLVCEATAGVFPGSYPPDTDARSLRGVLAWSAWWANMLTIQMFVRLFVLVGDAPCHDFHHRRPGKRWSDYIHARQADLEAGSPGFPINYVETWGLFRAVDENFAAMARAPAGLLG